MHTHTCNMNTYIFTHNIHTLVCVCMYTCDNKCVYVLTYMHASCNTQDKIAIYLQLDTCKLLLYVFTAVGHSTVPYAFHLNDNLQYYTGGKTCGRTALTLLYISPGIMSFTGSVAYMMSRKQSFTI